MIEAGSGETTLVLAHGGRSDLCGTHTSTLVVDGRTSLAGTRLWPGHELNNPAGLPRIRAPFFYIGTRNDWRAPLEEALSMVCRIGAPDKHTAFYPGSDHGRQLVESSRFAQQNRTLILRWITSHS